MIKKILITGATGKVGIEILKYLSNRNHQLDITAGVKDLDNDLATLSDFELNITRFDFSDPTSFAPALKNCHSLFLLLPSHMHDVESTFKLLIGIAKDVGVEHIVFLSVQGFEKSKLIPHHRIEKIIANSRISYTFLQPAYFMQNFTTSLKEELTANQRIFLPAGNAKFTLVDICDVGDVIARILADVSKHVNKSYELTSYDKLSFKEMAEDLSESMEEDIQYLSPNLLAFFIVKKKENMPIKDILRMILIHYYQRFRNEPATSKWVELIIGRAPVSFKQFISTNKILFNTKRINADPKTKINAMAIENIHEHFPEDKKGKRNGDDKEAKSTKVKGNLNKTGIDNDANETDKKSEYQKSKPQIDPDSITVNTEFGAIKEATDPETK